MPDIQWDAPAGLMRATAFATADTQEEAIARGTVHELVGQVLGMPAAQQEGLLIRAAGPDWAQEFDIHAIRELAARPEYSAANGGAHDTARLRDDPDRAEEAGVMLTPDGPDDDGLGERHGVGAGVRDA